MAQKDHQESVVEFDKLTCGTKSMSEKLSAFVKGGCGCLVGFIVIAFLAVILGGTAHIDIEGAIILFIIGGILGLVGLRIYKKGYTQGKEETIDQDGY